jgi:hypothetical protein
MFKHAALVLESKYGVKYSDKDPATAAWMLDTMELAAEAGDEELRSCCAAGLMLRFWSVFTKPQPGVETDYEEKISRGWEAIEYALKYKVWQDPSRNVNADQAVKKCIYTINLQHNYNANLDKSRANNFTASMDDEVGEIYGGEGKTTLGDTIVDEADLDERAHVAGADVAIQLVQSYINRKKLVEAIILDTIAFNDVNKETRKVVKYTDTNGNAKKCTQVYKEFWPFRCVQILSTLPETYDAYFAGKYHFNPAEFSKALSAIRNANNQKLYRFLDKTLADARDNVVL